MVFQSFHSNVANQALPSVETFQCKVCNVSVKYFREHLKSAHKITAAEYE